MFISFVGYVGSGLCGVLITRSEEYLVWCMCVCVYVSNLCDLETSKMRWPKTDVARKATEKKKTYCPSNKHTILNISVLSLK
jgi:hypothetical protein